jgi:hypothetical protein
MFKDTNLLTVYCTQGVFSIPWLQEFKQEHEENMVTVAKCKLIINDKIKQQTKHSNTFVRIILINFLLEPQHLLTIANLKVKGELVR